MKEEKKTFLLTFTTELVEKIDDQAKARYMTRTQYIREATVMRLNNEFIWFNAIKRDELIDKFRRQKYAEYLQKTLRYEDLTDDKE